jgi:hypothetical protein
MEHFYHNIVGYMNKQNIKTLRRAVKNVPKNYIWVELGSWTGRSAAFCIIELLNRDKTGKFFCVDTWTGSVEHQTHKLVETDTLYIEFLKNLNPAIDNITPLRMLSWEASIYFEDNSVDFCYVDAAHDYNSVMKDLNAWWPKIKIGGEIGGDDYSAEWPEVIDAVNKFFHNKNISVEVFGRCWIVKKL